MLQMTPSVQAPPFCQRDFSLITLVIAEYVCAAAASLSGGHFRHYSIHMLISNYGQSCYSLNIMAAHYTDSKR